MPKSYGNVRPVSKFLDIALRNAARGFKVHPLKSGRKDPATAHGFKDASSDESQIRDWWAKTPAGNVGIACGASGLAVLDIDYGLTDGSAWEAWRIATGLPETYTVRTGRRPDFGAQMYFYGPVPDVGLFELNGCKGQIKSLGGYVCAAGSLHPSGATYEALCDAAIAPTPDIVRALKTKKREQGADGRTEKIPEGAGRHAELTSIAGKLRNSGLDKDALIAALIPINESICEVPVPFEDLEHIAESVARYPVPLPEQKVIISSTPAPPDAAPLHQAKRPVYPTDVWDGTAVGEFAKLCAHDNNIPRKLYAEAFRCCLGAVVGERISCPVEGALPRSYTVVIAPKGKGKGTAIRRAVKFFSQEWYGTATSPGLLSGVRDFIWKPQGIGAWITAASSVPGMARLTKDLEKTVKNSPHMAWGNTLPRILSVHEEFKTFLSTLFIEGGVGSGMEGVVCQLWDDVTFNGTATGTREAVYGEMLFSLLAGVTEEDWFDLLSRGNAVGGGLMSRFNLIGTEGEYKNVGRMNPPDFTPLQESFLPRVRLLADTHTKILPTEGADKVISEWSDTLPEGSERMNVHAWRSALLLAWLRREEAITTKTAEDATRLGQYQVDSHWYYRTQAAANVNAKLQAILLRALTMKGPMHKRELQQRTHASRHGTELWNRALDGLLKERLVGKREDGVIYVADAA